MILGGQAPTCGICQKRVRQVSIEDLDQGPISVIVRCCGRSETVLIPREIFAAGESFAMDGVVVFVDARLEHAAPQSLAAASPRALPAAAPRTVRDS